MSKVTHYCPKCDIPYEVEGPSEYIEGHIHVTCTNCGQSGVVRGDMGHKEENVNCH